MFKRGNQHPVFIKCVRLDRLSSKLFPRRDVSDKLCHIVYNDNGHRLRVNTIGSLSVTLDGLIAVWRVAGIKDGPAALIAFIDSLHPIDSNNAKRPETHGRTKFRETHLSSGKVEIARLPDLLPVLTTRS